MDLASGLELRFEAPEHEASPLPRLARTPGEQGGADPCAYNAADEVAFAAFLDGRIGSRRSRRPSRMPSIASTARLRDDLDTLVAADTEARHAAEQRLVPA